MAQFTNYVVVMMFALLSAASAMEKVHVFGTEVAIPEDCRTAFSGGKNVTYCSEKPAGYPQDHIDRYLETYGFRNYDDKAKYVDEVAEDCPYNEKDRNCCTSTRWTKPYQVLIDNTIKIVVQADVFHQYIKEVSCTHENNECFKDLGLYEYRTSCKTDYAETNMYVIDSVSNHGEWAKTRIPVGCSCHIENNYGERR